MTGFTKAKDMFFPRCVSIGHDVVLGTGKLCRDLQFGNRGVIVTGENTYQAAGKQVNDIMAESKFDMAVEYTGNATIENVNAITERCAEDKAEFILAVGGGSKIDIAKIASMNLNIPFVSIPTSVAHDGIASDRASIKYDNGSRSVEAVSPTAIIADSVIISEAPFRYLAAGCADVIANLTAIKDWEFAARMRNVEMSSSANMLALYSAENLIENAHRIKPHLEDSIWLTMRPIITSGISMCIAGNSRPTSGSEHMFSHALDVLHPSDALHGEQCGLGTIMMMKLHGGDWMRIRNALHAIGAPITAGEIGISDEAVIDALVAAKDIRKDRFTILGDWGLTRKAAENLARSTGVI